MAAILTNLMEDARDRPSQRRPGRPDKFYLVRLSFRRPTAPLTGPHAPLFSNLLNLLEYFQT